VNVKKGETKENKQNKTKPPRVRAPPFVEVAIQNSQAHVFSSSPKARAAPRSSQQA
jgi:hypothetical protein